MRKIETLENDLRQNLKSAQRIAILGVGSLMRADDASGVLVAQNLKEALRNNSKVKIFLAETAVENFLGSLIKFNPTHVVMIDAVDIGKRAGTVKIIHPQEIKETSFSTHQLSLKFIIDYLKQSLDCEIILLGIQPASIRFGDCISPPVARSIKKLSFILQEAIF